MGFSQAGSSLVKRYPLATELVTRAGGAYTRDAYIQNGYVEFDPNTSEPNVVKRPGLSAGFTSGGTTAVKGQGLFNYGINGILILFSIVNNTLYRLTGGTINFGSSNLATWVTPSAPAPPIPLAIEGASIVFKNQLVLVSGVYPSVVQYLASVTATTDGITWNTLTSSPQWATTGGNNLGGGRSRFFLAVLNDVLYLMNGITANQNFNDCWFSNDGVNWSLATADMGSTNGIKPRIRSAVVTFNGNILLIGGVELTFGAAPVTVNAVISSSNGREWTKNATPAFSARSFAQAVVFNGAIYLCGGLSGSTYFLEVWKSLDANTWTQVYVTGWTGAVGKVFSRVVVVGNLMYAFAQTQSAGNIREVYSSPDGATWTALATPPWAAGVSPLIEVFRPPLNASGYPQYPQDVVWAVNQATNTVYYSALNVDYPSSWAIPTGGAVTAQFQRAEMQLGRYLFIKNTTDGHVYTANALTKVADPRYPQATVRGLVVMSSRAYVMDTLGNIRGSELNNPTLWPALDFIRADFANDAPVHLGRMQNYLVAFKVSSIMFFQSNGNQFGNSVSPVLNANALVGCGHANSVVEMANTIFWVSTYGGLRRSVSKLNGLSPVKISTDDVDRILDANNFQIVHAVSLKSGGQELYILSLFSDPAAPSTQMTLVYNNSNGRWSVWSSGADGEQTGTLPFRCINRAGLAQSTYMQDRLTNGVYEVSDTVFQDTDQSAVITAITTVIQSDKDDMNTNQFKFCASIDLIGDKYSVTNPVTVAYSDDDWLTNATWGACDLSLDRPQIYRGGSYRQRGHRFTHTANQALRANAFELTIEPGDV